MTNNPNQYSDKLTELDPRYNRLGSLQRYFLDNYNLVPVIGAEIEFYLSKEIDFKELGRLVGYDIKPEKGNNQYEINFNSSSDIIALAKEIELIRDKICDQARILKGSANFRAQPYSEDYGSSMHIHLNFPGDDNIEKYAQILCHYLPQYIQCFLPKKDDYKRLNKKFLAPTHIAWGGNNRTMLIRIPDSLPRRLEHRLAGANADPAEVIFAILDSIRLGLLFPEQVVSLARTYGNAYDEQYKLAPIIQTDYKG